MSIGTSVTKLFRFGLRGGMRSIEINREDFRRYLARKHKIHVADFRQALEQAPDAEAMLKAIKDFEGMLRANKDAGKR